MRVHLSISLLSVLFALAPMASAEQVPLSRVADVLGVQRTTIARGWPVRLQATVLYFKPGRSPDLFVRDGSSAEAVFVDTSACRVTLARGEVVEIEGIVSLGEFAPAVTATRLRIAGQASLPAVQPVSVAGINSLRDGQYVTLSGVVRHAFIDGSLDPPRLLVDLSTAGGKIRLWVLRHQDIAIGNLVDAEVRASGVVHYFRNGRTQPSGVRLLVSETEDLIIDRPPPADPFLSAATPLAEIETYSPTGVRPHRLHVTGTVTHLAGTTLFLQSGSGGVRVLTTDPPAVTSGDIVDVAGFSAMGERYGQIEDAICRLREPGKAPRAARPGSAKLDPALFDGGLVELDGTVRDRFRAQESQVLLLQRNAQFFQVSLSGSARPFSFESIALGSVVRVTGIWESIREPGDYGGGDDSFRVLLRHPEDLAVLQRGPWWTARRLTQAVVILALALAGGVAWMAFLRRRNLALERRVAARGAQLGQEIQARRETEVKFAAITAERNRLARDLHDTVEQMLTGAAVQLTLLTDLLPANDRKAVERVEFVRGILREAKAEARRSIWDLQPHLLQEHDLADALRELALQLTEGSNADFTISLTGPPRPIAMATERQLLRVGQEAITNAVKHAAAACIRVQIDFSAVDFVALRVSDDGCGFDVENARSTVAGHFGLDGIRDRARRIGGTCTIQSTPGDGTTVIVTVPQPLVAEAALS